MKDNTVDLVESLHRGRVGRTLRATVSWFRTPGWILQGRPAPSPPHCKQRIVAATLRRHQLKSFIETGTYRGDTLARLSRLADACISIELDPLLAELARRRFRGVRNVTILTGDSAALLPSIVSDLECPALFWLDGHYSAGPTAGVGSSPILAELAGVLCSPLPHVVLIDDLRLFDGTDGYPTRAELEAVVHASRPLASFSVTHDIATIVCDPGEL